MFAVFGMTPEYAKRKALANVKAIKAGKVLTEAEYHHEFQVYVTQILVSDKVVKVSPDFSTPEVANQWMELASRFGGVRMEVCICHPHKEVVKKGICKTRYKWSFYKKERNYSLKTSSWTITR